MPMSETDQFTATLIQQAKDFADRYKNGGIPMADVIKGYEEADLVVAIWPDEDQPLGSGLLIIKGDEHLLRSVREQETLKLKVFALPCINAAHAIIGEGFLTAKTTTAQ